MEYDFDFHMASDAAGQACRDFAIVVMLGAHLATLRVRSLFEAVSPNAGHGEQVSKLQAEQMFEGLVKSKLLFTDRLRIQPAEISRNKTQSNSSPVGGRNQMERERGRERERERSQFSFSSREIDFPMFLIFTDKEGAKAEVRNELCGPLSR